MTKKDITPDDSVRPVYLEPWTDDEIAANEALKKRSLDIETAKDAARQAVLDKLGLTEDEVKALLG